MKVKFLFLFIALIGIVGPIHPQPASMSKKMLVVYFSHSGNTKAVAYQICQKVKGQVFEIQTVKPYPADYNTLVEQAKKEQEADFRPELKSRVKNIRDYDVIFLGYPNWWGTYPQAVKTFLSQHDLSGKTVIPFCTHEGGGLGRSVADLKKVCSKSTIITGLAIYGSDAHTSEDKIEAWLQKLKMIK